MFALCKWGRNVVTAIWIRYLSQMVYNALFCLSYHYCDWTKAIFSAFVVYFHPIIHTDFIWPVLAHVTISGDVRNTLSIFIGPALEHLCCQRTHMFCQHSLLVAGCPLTTKYEWNLFKSAIFQKGFSTLKMQRTFHYRPKYVLFSPVKMPFFKPPCSMNKIEQVYNYDVTTVCICYVLLILHLYFLSCHYKVWSEANCLAFFTFA